jgi:hypothetical protein
MKKLSVFLVLLAIAAALPAAAQTQSNTIGEVIRVKVKTGQSQQWEAAVKTLEQWEHQHNIPDTIYMWSIIAGEHTGEYYVGLFGHNWKDFDAIWKETELNKEIGATVAPYTESIERSFYEFLPDVSSPIDPSQPPPAYESITFFQLKLGGTDAVMNVIKQANVAIKKTNWSGRKSAWYRLVEGGEYPQLVLSTGHDDWASFQEPSPSFSDILQQTFGKAGSEALGREFDKNVRSARGEIIQYRPDLSYIAASQ